MLKIIDKTTKYFAAFSGILILVMMLIIVYDVLMRYFLLKPTVWVQPMTEYMLVYAGFLGAAWVLSNNGHVNINLVVKALNKPTQASLTAVTSSIGALVCLVLVWQTGERFLSVFGEGMSPFLAFSLPEWTVYISIPVGSLLLSIHFVIKAYYAILLRKNIQTAAGE